MRRQGKEHVQRACVGKEDGKSKGLKGLWSGENGAGVECREGVVANHTEPSNHNKEF